MPAPLHVKLSAEEDTTLRELSVAQGVPRRTRQRASAVRLSGQGWRVPQIAQYLQLHEHTVRSSLRRWESVGLYGLWEKPHPGRKPRWHEPEVEAVEQWLSEERSYTSRQLCSKLKQERQVDLSPRTMSRLLKKKGSAGSDCATVRPAHSNRSS